jgi:creatinine amidohydrolase/Fe(II)-dependent formamide hydrolase-like protein
MAAQKKPAAPAPLVEFEMMTWPEVKKAIEGGKTTALVYNGGTEQRGPQNVNGGHTLMGRAIVRAIALKLGNEIAAPVLPFSPNRAIALKLGNAIAAPVLPFSPNRASAELPGTIGLSAAAFAMINEEVAEQLLLSGFKTVILMGDHGGGQAELKTVAEKLDAKHAAEGKHVYYCDEVYARANADFDEWLKANNYPVSQHAGIPDTSEMLYLGGDKGWVRKELVATALGDPILPRGQAPDPSVKRINNGISGDGRKSTAELGKRLFDMKVDYAVAQIQKLMATK